jgi:anaerobic selenocysteine-containing dehydrogenase
MQAHASILTDNGTMKLKTTCNRDCPDACGLVATVDDGRVVKLEGDPDHPVTRGFLCFRTRRFLERQYDPERITEPLARRGDGFEPISWDEALDRIAERMLRIKGESGSAAILHYRSVGAMGMMKHVTDHFFERFGPVSIKVGDICSGAGEFAQETDFGVSDSNDIFDLLNSRTIVMWGKNPYVSYLHLLPLLKEAKAKGARLVQIDPVHHRGADLADLYLQPRPGGDIALALGAARILFERGLTDPQAPSYCDHFEEFRELAFSHELDTYAGWADVRPEQIEEVAEAYADGPSNIVVGWGMQRRARGAATIRVIDALGAISGNVGVLGGGVSFYFRRRGAFDLSFVRGREIAPRTIPESLLGTGILEASDPEIRMVWVTSGNPVAMLPESRTVERALRSRELTVVVDSFLTDTARCADLILPTTTMLEDDDLIGAYGHHWLADMQPVVAPPDGVKTDFEIVRELAPRVGLNSDLSDDVEIWKRRILSGVENDGVSLEALREGAVRNPRAPDVLFSDRRFPTPTGRARLIHDADPRPDLPPEERPLLLAALSTKDAQASQWPSHAQRGPATATVHPDAAPGFGDGDLARVESEIGSLTVKLKLDGRQRRDMLLMDKGGWLQAGRCANVLIRARETDHGGCAVYYDTPVRLLRPEPIPH